LHLAGFLAEGGAAVKGIVAAAAPAIARLTAYR
jgi:hypothetical protein